MKSSSSTISTSSSVRGGGGRRRLESDAGREDVVRLGRRDEFSSSVSTLGLDDDEGQEGQPGSSGAAAATPTPQELAERAAIREAGKARHRRFMANMMEKLPMDFKKSGKMVACMICSLIKPQDEFEEDGCDNCERILQAAGVRGKSAAYTSENYEGLIGLLDPRESWVSKNLLLRGKKAGLYAVNVKGIVSGEILQDLADADIDFRSRDRSIVRDRARQYEEELGQEEDEIAKRRASRKIRRRRRKTEKKAEKKAAKAKAKAEKAAGRGGRGGEQSESEDVEVAANEEEDDNNEQPPETRAIPPLTIIHGKVKGVGASIGKVGSECHEKTEKRTGTTYSFSPRSPSPVYVWAGDEGGGGGDDDDGQGSPLPWKSYVEPEEEDEEIPDV